MPLVLLEPRPPPQGPGREQDRPPGEDRRFGLHPGPAVHAPPDPAAAPALADAAPGGPGILPRPPPAARRSGLQLLDALTGRRAVWAGQRWSVSDYAASAPGLGLAFLGSRLLVTLVVWGQLTGGNWTLSSRKLNSMFVCLFIRLFVYSLGFSSVMGFSLVVFILGMSNAQGMVVFCSQSPRLFSQLFIPFPVGFQFHSLHLS